MDIVFISFRGILEFTYKSSFFFISYFLLHIVGITSLKTRKKDGEMNNNKMDANE